MRQALPLACYRRPVIGPLHLLSRSENGLTFALGYALACVPRLLQLFTASFGQSNSARHLSISLQEPGKDGITDIELWIPSRGLVAIVEAKKGGWPGRKQLARYANRLHHKGVGRPALIPLGVPPQPPALSELRRLNGVRVVSQRWADVLQLVSDALPGRNEHEAETLFELKALIQEVIGMRSYDREVLIRDLKIAHTSYELYLDHNLYACQVTERSEPLFFAPCFVGAKNRRANGIQYVSRVYCRSNVRLSSVASVRDALAEAMETVNRIAKPLRHRKTATEQLEYLEGLHKKWRRGFDVLDKKGWRDETAVYFLGDPIRLPIPLAKKGSMVPPGFSMTMEQLMSAQPGVFRC